MLYRYKAIDQNTGDEKTGTIDAATVDVAIAALQRRNFIIISIVSADDLPFYEKLMNIGAKVPYRDVVVLSRQMATLFKAQVSALRVFQLLSEQTENEMLKKSLVEVAEDIQGGMSLSNALGKHSGIFSDFYVNMIRAGEESGNLSNTFGYLADYLDRTYELIAKTRNALVYPIFVIVVFIVVMILMLVIVIPKLSAIILETGKELPIYTKVVIGMSNLMVNYGIFFLVFLVISGFIFWRFVNTTKGKETIARFSLDLPFVGNLYRKLYLARITNDSCGNFNRMNNRDS